MTRDTPAPPFVALGLADPDSTPFANKPVGGAYAQFVRSLDWSPNGDAIVIGADENGLPDPQSDTLAPGEIRLLSLLVRPSDDLLEDLSAWRGYWLEQLRRCAPDEFDEAAEFFEETMDEYTKASLVSEAQIALGERAPRGVLWSIETSQMFGPGNGAINLLRLVRFNRSWSILTQTSEIDGMPYSCVPRCLGFARTDDWLRSCCAVLGSHPYSLGPYLDDNDWDVFETEDESPDPDRPLHFDRRFEVSADGCDRFELELLLLCWTTFGECYDRLYPALPDRSDSSLRETLRTSGTLLNRRLVGELYCEATGRCPPGEEDEEDFDDCV